MIRKINSKTRLKLQFHIPAIDVVFCLQRKVWYGWKTVSWVSPSIMISSDISEIIKYLEYEEQEFKIKEKKESEFEIGKKILENN